MHPHLARPPARTPKLLGLTASAVAFAVAGLAAPAAAQTSADEVGPRPPDGEDAPTTTGPQGETAPEPTPEPAAPAEPAPEPVRYTVAPGDFLASIAAAHGLDPVEGWRALFDANPDVADPDLIVPGQVLRIPDAAEVLEPRALPAPAPVPGTEAAATHAPGQSTPGPGPAPATEPRVNTSAPAGAWDRLAQCESGGNWHINTGNGYYGGLQFSQSSWQAVGGAGLPHEASREEQISRGQQLQGVQGWSAWPACSRKLGLR
ncbi:MAG TPA: transglycosylase family protein [Egibacteraceae bacterium]|nr:transglycosylase family protein [Egibacteraceae bacterium]